MNKQEIKLEYKRNKSALKLDYKAEKTRLRYPFFYLMNAQSSFIIESGKFKDLPIELKEVCNLRKGNPESSIGELATMCKTPISKSGMNHRLNKLIKIAGEI